MATRAEYREITSVSALNRVQGMPLKCIPGLCPRLSLLLRAPIPSHFDLNAGDDFTGVIFVKTNIVDLLREELWLPGRKRELIALGTATDPYQPIEGRYRLARSWLEALAERKNLVSLVTKGPMVVRDIDILSSFAACTVCVSITTVDESLARRIEPTTAPPRQRLRAVSMLAEASVRVGLLIAPVVPGITDDVAGLEAVAQAVAEHGASFLGGRVLHLKEGTKEHSLDFLALDFPHLVHDYDNMYPGSMAPRAVQSDVDDRLARLRRLEGWMRGNNSRPRRLASFVLALA